MDEEARDRLKLRLDEVHEWPSVYMFKFIFEPEQERTNAILALFPAESEVLRKYSSGGKYLSITVREVMLSACLLYTSDAADERSSVDLGGRRTIKKKKKIKQCGTQIN